MRIGFRGSISGKGFGGKGIKAILGLFGGGGGDCYELLRRAY